MIFELPVPPVDALMFGAAVVTGAVAATVSTSNAGEVGLGGDRIPPLHQVPGP